MATIKSFTSLEQSRKLAEFLPLESADMVYLPTHIGDEHHFIASLSPYSMCTKMTEVSIEYCTPCWSLTALLGVLPKIGSEEPMIQKLYYANNPTERYFCQYSLTNITGEYDNPVDACYEMIIKLNELKML